MRMKDIASAIANRPKPKSLPIKYPKFDIYPKYKWINFVHLKPKTGQKTSIWIIKTNEGDETLGLIKWFSRWRKYSFFPCADTVYENECLKDIAYFIEVQMNAWRDSK